MKCAQARPAVITARQLRAARKLLGWSQRVLACKARVALNTIRRLERSDSDPRFSTLNAIEKTFAKAGVEFIPADGQQGEGVWIKRGR